MGMRTVEETEDVEDYVEMDEDDDEKSSIEKLKAEKEKAAGRQAVNLNAPWKEEPGNTAAGVPEGVDPDTGEISPVGESQQQEQEKPKAGPSF